MCLLLGRSARLDCLEVWRRVVPVLRLHAQLPQRQRPVKDREDPRSLSALREGAERPAGRAAARRAARLGAGAGDDSNHGRLAAAGASRQDCDEWEVLVVA